MFDTSSADKRSPKGLVAWIKHLWHTHAPLTLFALVMAGFTLDRKSVV